MSLTIFLTILATLVAGAVVVVLVKPDDARADAEYEAERRRRNSAVGGWYAGS